MTEAKFKIGDQVKLVSCNGSVGKIVDVLHSNRFKSFMYEVATEFSQDLYTESDLEPAPIVKVYSFEAVVDAGAAIVTMFDVTDENAKTVVSRGHAHILHDGEVGMAQAVSFAARRMFEAMDRKGEDRIYFKRGEVGGNG